MADEDDLWALEERFWTEGADSARHMTAKDAVFVFPYPAGILQGGSLWRESRVAQPWRSVVLTERYFKQEKTSPFWPITSPQSEATYRSTKPFVHPPTYRMTGNGCG